MKSLRMKRVRSPALWETFAYQAARCGANNALFGRPFPRRALRPWERGWRWATICEVCFSLGAEHLGAALGGYLVSSVLHGFSALHCKARCLSSVSLRPDGAVRLLISCRFFLRASVSPSGFLAGAQMRSSVLLPLCYSARAKRAGQEEDCHRKPSGAARGGRRFVGAE